MKKIFAFVLIAAAVMTLFAGCGKKTDGEVSVFYYTYSDTYISSVRDTMDKILKNEGIKFNNYDRKNISCLKLMKKLLQQLKLAVHNVQNILKRWNRKKIQ